MLKNKKSSRYFKYGLGEGENGTVCFQKEKITLKDFKNLSFLT